MQIKSFNRSLKSSFFIARVGQVGKPLRKPYTSNNSFMVISDNPEIDFQRVKAAYESGAFEPYKLGSVQPCIRIEDVRRVIDQCKAMEEKHLNQMAQLEKLIELQREKVKKHELLLKQLQRAAYASC